MLVKPTAIPVSTRINHHRGALVGPAAAAAVMVLAVPPVCAQVVDFTCLNGGTKKRIAVVQQNAPAPLPCSVSVLERPLGSYHQIWKQPWRAVNEAGFCEIKASEIVDEHMEAGWKCLPTERWRRG